MHFKMRQLVPRPSLVGRALALPVLLLPLILTCASYGDDLAFFAPPPRSVAYIASPAAVSSFWLKNGYHCIARCHVLPKPNKGGPGCTATTTTSSPTAVSSSYTRGGALRMAGNSNVGKGDTSGSEEKLELAAEVRACVCVGVLVFFL